MLLLSIKKKKHTHTHTSGKYSERLVCASWLEGRFCRVQMNLQNTSARSTFPPTIICVIQKVRDNTRDQRFGHWPWPTFFLTALLRLDLFFPPSVGESLIGVLDAVTFYLIVYLVWNIAVYCKGRSTEYGSVFLSEEEEVTKTSEQRMEGTNRVLRW